MVGALTGGGDGAGECERTMMEAFARHLLGGRHAMSLLGILALAAAALGWIVCLPILRKGLADVRRIPGGGVAHHRLPQPEVLAARG